MTRDPSPPPGALPRLGEAVGRVGRYGGREAAPDHAVVRRAGGGVERSARRLRSAGGLRRLPGEARRSPVRQGASRLREPARGEITRDYPRLPEITRDYPRACARRPRSAALNERRRGWREETGVSRRSRSRSAPPPSPASRLPSARRRRSSARARRRGPVARRQRRGQVAPGASGRQRRRRSSRPTAVACGSGSRASMVPHASSGARSSRCRRRRRPRLQRRPPARGRGQRGRSSRPRPLLRRRSRCSRRRCSLRAGGAASRLRRRTRRAAPAPRPPLRAPVTRPLLLA